MSYIVYREERKSQEPEFSIQYIVYQKSEKLKTQSAKPKLKT